jgi:hypothetical protein
LFTRNWSRISLEAALCATALLASGCVQPLGPGFRFVDRQTEIRPAPGAPERLQVRVVDRFENVGDRPLHSLDARLPGELERGPDNFRVTIDGRSVLAQRISGGAQRLMRAPFDPVWEQRQPREIVTDWEFPAGPAERESFAASAVAFYLGGESLLPLWQPPQGIFVRGEPYPKQEDLTVFAPADFRVLAPGKPVGQRSAGSLIGHRFRLRPREDFPPFVVAGRYQEQVFRIAEGAVNFWTLHALDTPQAEKAAARLGSSVRAFNDYFGPASKQKFLIHVVEAPVDLPAEFLAPEGPGVASFPNGVLLDPRAMAQGFGSSTVLELSEYELARTWFGGRLHPRPGAELLMGRGARLFALVVAAEARGQGERRRTVALLLNRYDDSRRIAMDRALNEPPEGYSTAERLPTGYRAALFFVALEDLCGRDNFRAALFDMIQARSGDDVGMEELRAAVEAASHRDLSDMFRAWMNRPGVPEDFRTRYAGGSRGP